MFQTKDTVIFIMALLKLLGRILCLALALLLANCAMLHFYLMYTRFSFDKAILATAPPQYHSTLLKPMEFTLGGVAFDLGLLLFSAGMIAILLKRQLKIKQILFFSALALWLYSFVDGLNHFQLMHG